MKSFTFILKISFLLISFSNIVFATPHFNTSTTISSETPSEILGLTSNIPLKDDFKENKVVGPEIDVKGNGLSIPDGNVIYKLIDNTDFGQASFGITITRSFTIINTGTSDLNISSTTLSGSDFTIVTFPAATVSPGGSTSLSVSFATFIPGVKSTILTINNDDSDEAIYDFRIKAFSENTVYDSDGDGKLDHVDLDDDNDGISDIQEESNCKNSSISVPVNYKYYNETFGAGTNRVSINTSYGAETNLTYETVGNLDDGKYTVNNSAQVASWAAADWYTGEDHTAGDTNGRMAVFNGTNAPDIYYTASIKGALPGVPFSYSFWMLNLNTSATRVNPNLKVEFRDVNNTVLSTVVTGPISPSINGNPSASWQNISGSYTPTTTEFTVYFINNATSGTSGNDFALDDIEFKQTLCDTDNDGVADVFDLDSDNDGIPDVVETGLGNQSSGKANLFYASGWTDTNGDGVKDSVFGHIALDSDGDGIPNYLDLDSDNDGIFDVDESGAGNANKSSLYQNGDGDIDGDGVGDGTDTDFVRKRDVFMTGTPTFFADGILNIYDAFNGSTMATAYGNAGQGAGNTFYVLDSDGDNIPNFIDITSDGSIFDISKTHYEAMDVNNDGRIDGNSDADGDGILDLFDTNDAAFGSPKDLTGKYQLQFDGRNDYAQEPSVINGWGEVTMMGWFKLDTDSNGTKALMGQDQFQIRWVSNRRFQILAKGSISLTAEYRRRGEKETWRHIAATYSSSDSRVRLYINGTEIGTGIATSGALPIDNSPFTLGKNPSTNADFFHGSMDEIKVFNKALTADEIRKMVYQEVQNNSGIIRGSIIPKDITNYISPSSNIPLPWSSMVRYYRMDTYKGNIIDDLKTPTIDVGTGLRMYNLKNVSTQNAPLPFVTRQTGPLDASIDSPNIDLITGTPLPGDGVRGLDAVENDWSIVHVKHPNITYSDSQKHLGLIIDEKDASNIPIDFNVLNNSELNVSWYLKLDGNIKLEGESQLVQGSQSDLDVTSKGRLEKDQQGTVNKFTYNYWSSPVSPRDHVNSLTANNNAYRTRDVMKDGASNITWLTSGYNGATGTPISIADYWIWKYANQPDNTISAWQHIRSTGTLEAGEGYTMKGPGNGVVSQLQNYRFSGKPNNGNIDLTLGGGNDYLVGNPYPSAIDGVKFIEDNGPIISGEATATGTLYFWEHWGGGSHNLADYQGGYAVYNLSGGSPSATQGVIDPNVGMGGMATKIPGRYIPVGQGFFVVAEGSGGTIKFRNSQRVFIKEGTANSVFIRGTEGTNTVNYNPDGDDPRMKLRIGFNSTNTIHRQLLVTADSNATQGIDWGYDGAYIDDQMDDMYWMINSEKFVIQGIDTIIPSSIIPLGMHLRDGGQNTITIDKLENVPDELDIYVHDKTLDTYHNLRQSDYIFDLPAGEYLNRYDITFQQGSVLTVEEEDDLTAIEVFYANAYESLVVVNPTLRDIKRIELFNIVGQSVGSFKSIETTNYAEYKVKNLSTGAYIVKMYTAEGSTSKKVLVK